MVKLTPKERKVQRDHLNRRRNTLQKQGASNKEIRRLLGGFDFAGLSDTQLNILYNQSKSVGRVTVVNNTIVKNDYLKKVKAWYGTNYQPEKVSSSYAKQLKSTLNQFQSVSDIKRYRNEMDKTVKQRYIDHLEYQLEKLKSEKRLAVSQEKAYRKTVSAIKRLSRNDFKNFINGDLSSKTDFDAIFIVDSPNNQTDEAYNDYEFTNLAEQFEGLGYAVNQFKAFKTRK